jgi:hypothetical protein
MQKVKQIVYKKLGRQRKAGLAWCDDGIIHIDERLKGYEMLYVTIHEIMHIQNSTWSEIKVEGHSKEMADLLWAAGFRKSDL